MTDKSLEIDGKKIQLEEVASVDNKKLYRFNYDWRICGAPLKEVKRRFPDYKFENGETSVYDFLYEEDGKLQLYGPDGEPINEDEL